MGDTYLSMHVATGNMYRFSIRMQGCCFFLFLKNIHIFHMHYLKISVSNLVKGVQRLS